MDCDGSLDPADLPLVSSPGLRRAGRPLPRRPPPAPRRVAAHARLANRLLALEVSRRTGLRLRDIGPMRAARRAALLELELRDRAFGWPLEMVLRASQDGLEDRRGPRPLPPAEGRPVEGHRHRAGHLPRDPGHVHPAQANDAGPDRSDDPAAVAERARRGRQARRTRTT